MRHRGPAVFVMKEILSFLNYRVHGISGDKYFGSSLTFLFFKRQVLISVHDSFILVKMTQFLLPLHFFFQDTGDDD